MSQDFVELLLSDKSLTTKASPSKNSLIKNADQVETINPEIQKLSKSIKNGSYSEGYELNNRELEIRRLLYFVGFERGVKAALKKKAN